jgi:cell division transport system permease protein
MIERALRAVRSDLRLHILSIFSVAVAFVCLSATLLVAVNIDAIRGKWSETGRASVYLAPDADPQTIQTVRQALLAAEAVTDVTFVSSEQARGEVMGNTHDEALMALPEEAFPASLEVTLEDVAATERVERLAAQLKALPAVEAVETYHAWGERLDKLLRGGVQAALILLAVVLAAVVSVVGSTMRMALARRRTEVEVLKMVGATDSYVRGPFVIEGAAQGGIGALSAVLLIGGLFLIVRDAFEGSIGTLLGVSPQFLPWTFCIGLVILGAGIGALSAFASLRRLIANPAT